LIELTAIQSTPLIFTSFYKFSAFKKLSCLIVLLSWLSCKNNISENSPASKEDSALLERVNYLSEQQNQPRFKIMVMNRRYLFDSIFVNGVKEITLVHTIAKLDSAGINSGYYLIAYVKELDGSYTKINQSALFTDREVDPRFVIIKNSASDERLLFSNTLLKKSEIPEADTLYKYIILRPVLFGNGFVDENQFIGYLMSLSSNKDELSNSTFEGKEVMATRPHPPSLPVPDTLMHPKIIRPPKPVLLNPSPPR
jgi:hypothetical protein